MIGDGWKCPKCGCEPPEHPPKISWISDKPKKLLIQCIICGFFEFVNSLDAS